MTNIIWHTDAPEGVEAIVQEDIAVELDGLGAPEDLVFHTVFLGDDYEGPCVILWGVEGDEKFHAEYHASAELVSITEVSIH